LTCSHGCERFFCGRFNDWGALKDWLLVAPEQVAKHSIGEQAPNVSSRSRDVNFARLNRFVHGSSGKKENRAHGSIL
jgi:hypothetical protein